MRILGIETSCDETGAAVIEGPDQSGRVRILSNVVASSVEIQAKYGGVIPEQAAREQLRSIIPVVSEAIENCNLDAIAVTQGPGLIGSLLVGVETAKALSLIWKKPLIPVNHLLGHFYANWINDTPYSIPSFPCLGLLVSGGHTDLVLFGDHGKYDYLGGTRDDAAGECFDKCARLLGLPYPGGPQLAKLAEKGNPKAFNLPRPMVDSDDFDFSFSGLKTAVVNLTKEKLDVRSGKLPPSNLTPDLAASIQEAIIDVLVTKTVRAAQKHNIDQIIVAGGVAANQELVRKLKVQSEKLKVKLYMPPANLCTDNAAMIAACAAFNYHPLDKPLSLQSNPHLSLSI